VGCSLRHAPEARQRIVPGLYRCTALVTILAPQPVGPGGAVQSIPTTYPHGELYYDDSVEPIAACPCGRYAVTVCGHCRRLIGGSTLRLEDGFTDTAFLLTSGAVVRAVAPEERRPGLIATRRLEPAALNLLALAELGQLLGLRPPS
jgi:hypothetical protein